MKIKTISKLLKQKFDDFAASIEDKELRERVQKNTIITGGAIASMLQREEVNDYDLYFRDKETTVAVAEHYVAQFVASHADKTQYKLRVNVDKDGRVCVFTDKGANGKDRPETAGDVRAIQDSGSIEDTYVETEQAALNTGDEAGKPKYRPVFLSTNAITLSHKVQLVLRFYGEPEEIHKNYDFVHCTNYWTSWDEKLTLRQEALESLMTKELRYVGSKYPVCSLIRLRKFIARQWTVNAGQILKMVMQVNELDLTNIEVLRDQLTGVDSAYFCDLIGKLKEKDPEKVNAAYLVEIIDRMF